ncbi:MAG: winged helix-turn-helix transcriptional regulator [Ruminococcaceae bacterium]|nr:winged helix-turn-helix transcriptional regulator [Oscillospiraceae bacterium]
MHNLNVNGKAPEHNNDSIDPRKSPMLLINEITRLMGEKLREKDADNPITQKSERYLLLELAKRDGRTQLDLVKATHMKAPTISVALQKMEHAGFVMRRPDEYDLRATRVFLTEKGRALDDAIKRRICEEENIAMSNLNSQERETLVRILAKIKYNILLESENTEDIY